MKNWQERLVEELSGASKAWLKHRRTSKFYYQTKDNKDDMRKSVSSYHKSNIVKGAIPVSTKREISRKMDPKYMTRNRSKFGTKYPSYQERLEN